MDNTTNFRMETDTFGEIEVPKKAYWGASTARSLMHFSIGHHKMPAELIRAFGSIKKACAEANFELGILSSEKKDGIVKAAQEVADGLLNEHFPLSIWQTGSGTQTNMNVNEVIANRAIELAGGKLGSKKPIHPNDHVNLSQSSNDTFPTAMHIASSRMIHLRFLPMLHKLKGALLKKGEEYQAIIKMGRTHLMDALPVTLGQEFFAYAEQLEQNSERMKSCLPSLKELALGATAVGTGYNCPKGFAELAISKISRDTQLEFIPAKNNFVAIGSHDPLIFAHGALNTLAASLIKIATDLSWMGSGPRAGLGELLLPENEPGSSIMPGKINPTQCEALAMVAVHVMGNHQTITIAGSRGNFELNVYKPVIIYNFLESLVLLSDSMRTFADYFVEKLRPNRERMDEYCRRSLMLVTALSQAIGYDKCSKIALKAYHENLTLREACLELGFLGEKEFDERVDPKKMI